MKKILSVLFFALALTTSVWADDVISRDVKKLPVAAQNFIKKNFPKSKVSYIKIDKDLLEAATYEAILEDGVQIDFNNKGEWTEIDCKLQPVPAALIPAILSPVGILRELPFGVTDMKFMSMAFILDRILLTMTL